MIIRLIYTFFLGLLLALFVGVGIAAFYPMPKPPVYPSELEGRPYMSPVSGPKLDLPAEPETEEMKAKREAYDKESQEFFDKVQPAYHRNVSVIALVAALIILVISLSILGRADLFADGMLLGGVFTLCYSVAVGFQAEDNLYRFIVTTVGLIVALGLGYLKFVRPDQKSKK